MAKKRAEKKPETSMEVVQDGAVALTVDGREVTVGDLRAYVEELDAANYPAGASVTWSHGHVGVYFRLTASVDGDVVRAGA